MAKQRTIIAPATAPIQSALALIRVSGNQSITVTATLVAHGDRIRQSRSHTIHYDTLIDPATSKPIDCVVILVYRAPHSYTGEDTVEICCHGNPAIVRAIVALYRQHGVEMAAAGEFTLRALTNGKMDLTQAEAVAAVIAAQSTRARAAALSHLSGALRNEIDAIKRRLVTVAAAINIQLDYPAEESGDITIDTTNIAAAEAALQRLIASYQIGRLVFDGIAIIIMGKTNSGKSTLFNRLIREERAIVSDQHGTTRDYLEAQIEINGMPVRLFDTAGLRETTHTIEREGIARGERLSAGARIILYVVDGTIGIDSDERQRLLALSSGAETAGPAGEATIIVVYNKADQARRERASHPIPGATVKISAQTGDGMEALIAMLSALVTPDQLTGTEQIDGEDDGQMIISSQRQAALLGRAAAALTHARKQLAAGTPLDMLVLDIEEAINALGHITGEVTSADILKEMFSGFCVGK